jgi:hypothetical protein
MRATQVNIYQAKAELSALLQRALAGETIVIADRFRPMPITLESIVLSSEIAPEARRSLRPVAIRAGAGAWLPLLTIDRTLAQFGARVLAP